MHDGGMNSAADLEQLSIAQLRQLLVQKDEELRWRQARIDQLTHELAHYKRHRYGVKAERLPAEQAQLFEESADEDLASIEAELKALSNPSAQSGNVAEATGAEKEKAKPRRKALTDAKSSGG